MVQLLTQWSRNGPWALVATFLQLVCLPIAGWVLLQQIEHGERLTAIESSRFSYTDGALIGERVTRLEETVFDDRAMSQLEARIAERTELVIRAEMAIFKAELREELWQARQGDGK